eukprot:749557-Hanusia_phi.AAC.3
MLHCFKLVLPGIAKPLESAQALVQSLSEVQGMFVSVFIMNAMAACAMGTNVKEVPSTEIRPVPRK